ncbi:MAG: family 43 glycosylhydrolase [Thermoleophilia bacterium]|nr:family 43 glycosylhydrolase [Thermoleophilia bacterium]
MKTPGILLAALAALACAGSTPPTSAIKKPLTGYVNPVIDQDFPDPSLLRTSSGVYYAYATQTVRSGSRINIQAARSTDLVTWTTLGDVLPTKPTWASTTWNFWAPHVLWDAAQGKYFMYFAAQHDTARLGMCLGVATATDAGGPFIDAGTPLICGTSSGDFSHIDAMAFDDSTTGRRYLYWGSNSQPIVGEELDGTRLHFRFSGLAPDTLLRASTDPYESLIEGPWVIKRGSWYYLFYSGNDCCNPTSPHYAVLVARASSPLGPYTKLGDANGTHNSVILQANSSWLAPGHNAIIADQAGTDWIVYHAIDPAQMYIPGTNRNVRRPMLIDKIVYTNGWPGVESDAPSRSDKPKPVVTP